MAKLQVVRQQDGSYAAMMPDGSMQPIPQQMMGEVELPMSGVQNERGLGFAERMTFMNVTNSPEDARRYLEGIGYETRKLPEEAGAWNFAVRKSSRDPWRLVDPIGGLDIEDITDLVADLGIGATSAIGMAKGAALGTAVGGPIGGIVGGIAGAGIGSAVGEVGRQGIGAATVPQQGFDAGNVALSGALGAASVPVGAAAGKAIGLAGKGALGLARRAGRLGNEFAAKMASVGEGGTMTSGELNLARAMEPEAITQRLPSGRENARSFIDVIRQLDDSMSTKRGNPALMGPEKKAEVEMLREAAKDWSQDPLYGTMLRRVRQADQAGARFGGPSLGGLSPGGEDLVAKQALRIVRGKQPWVFFDQTGGMTQQRLVTRVVEDLDTLTSKEWDDLFMSAQVSMDSDALIPKTVDLRPAAQRMISLVREKIAQATSKTSTVRTASQTTGESLGTSVAGSTKPKVVDFADTDLSVTGPRARGPRKGAKRTRRRKDFSRSQRETTTTRETMEMVEQPLKGDAALEALGTNLPEKAARFMEKLQNEVLGDHPLTAVPVDLADAVTEHIEDILQSQGGKFGDLLQEFATGSRNAIVDAMGGPQSPYGLNRAILDAAEANLKTLKRHMRWGLRYEQVVGQTKKLLETLDAGDYGGYLSLLSDLEKQFRLEPDTLTRLLRRSVIAKRFGSQGAAQTLGPVTAGGSFRGSAAIGPFLGGGTGAALGFLSGGGIPGAIAGAGIGTALGSPVTLGLATKAGVSASRALTRAETALSGSMSSDLTRQGLAGATRATVGPPVANAGVAREKSRKRVHIGQF